MKRLLALALLAACAKTPEVPPPDVPGLLRNPTAPLASQTDVTAKRLEGQWYVRQAAGSFKTGAAIEIAQTETGLRMTSTLNTQGPQILLTPTGAGRWDVTDTSGGFPSDPLWVLWLDFDDRTAVIGGPTGKFVWIMDRAPSGGADRLVAARDILDWYGYDVTKLEQSL